MTTKDIDKVIGLMKALKKAIFEATQDYQTKTDGRIRKLEDKHKRDIQELNDKLLELEMKIDRKEKTIDGY